MRSNRLDRGQGPARLSELQWQEGGQDKGRRWRAGKARRAGAVVGAVALALVLAIAGRTGCFSRGGCRGVSAALHFSQVSQPQGSAQGKPPLSNKEYCQQEHVDELAADMRARHAATCWSCCPSQQWLTKLQEISDPKVDRAFIDIGCNKGFTSAHLFALWAPQLHMNPQALTNFSGMTDCGACGDCNEKVVRVATAPTGQQAGVQVVCVEPNLASVDHLKRVWDHYFNTTTAQPQLQWHIVNAAVTNSSESHAPFPRCTPGNEICGFTTAQEYPDEPLAGFDMVPLLSVDRLLEVHGLQYVDVLKMDTEGFDALAIASGQSSFAAGKVGILMFEYHGVGDWPQYRLENVVEAMEKLTYVCYFSGKAPKAGSLVRLTGCWSPRYEFHMWSNVVCIRRDHELYPHMEAMSSRYKRYPDVYF